MMNASGTKFSGNNIVPHLDLRSGATSDSIIRKEVNRIATWNVRPLGVCGKLENMKIEMKCLNINILGMGEIEFWSDNYTVIYLGD